MAITIRERATTPIPLTAQLSIDPALLERPEAQAARQRGLLRAKADALHATERLVGWARPLLISVLVVSFLHLWHQIARIAPEGVPALLLPAWTHWLSAALLTISVDATALYLVATRSAAQYARLGGQGAVSVWFFYLLTAALNSLFVLSYTPGLPTQVQAITPALSLLGAILLGLLVPVSIAALERARQVADVARLSLLVEVEMLRGVVIQQAATSTPHTPADASYSAAAPISEASPTLTTEPLSMPAITRGRTVTHTVVALISTLTADEIISPSTVRQRLGCGETTAHRLLQEACEAGAIERAGRGAYRLVDR
ncbi:hypothetical protein K2Z83_19860 [Oscillochloris sp. ZM17-4]|uniref:hypothetical protein n=1 Tax=Oscillochloris sp. ZM17-4 TaxID=2866714 RepID=UPI001C73359C|nr:hypothetical protein [Oscillochloris sp. ZM17-4]MBX0329925.1 hypothetical protein [Oscillochloris sp. ZM17-4]